MAQFSAVDAPTVAGDWDAGDYLRYDKFRDQIGQVIENLRQNHNHDGGAGDGGFIPMADPKALWFYGLPPGTPFA